jgi:hypothetical protein
VNRRDVLGAGLTAAAVVVVGMSRDLHATIAALPDGVRYVIPAGTYHLAGPLHLYGKRGVELVATDAQFVVPTDGAWLHVKDCRNCNVHCPATMPKFVDGESMRSNCPVFN